MVAPEQEEEKKQTSNGGALDIESLPEWIPRERLKEAVEVRDMLSQMDRQVKEGSTWFLIGNQWMEKWQKYVFYDVINGETQPTDIKESELVAEVRARPGSISNEDILMDLPKGQYLLEVANNSKWQN